MSKTLYFVCPTDNLEKKISSVNTGEIFFHSALGDALIFEEPFLTAINDYIINHGITNIVFVLSNQNKVFTTIINNKDFCQSPQLLKIYQSISTQVEQSKNYWQDDNLRDYVIKEFLTRQVEALQQKINYWVSFNINVEAQIYQPNLQKFSNITPDKFRDIRFSLN